MEASWLDCRPGNDAGPPPGCLAALKPGDIILRIQRRAERGPHILGTAVVQDDGPNVVASVYAGSIEDRAIKTGVPLTIILGRVTAHEIGHLLLGTNSHAPTGLMRPAWDVRLRQPDEWQFTATDAAKIRRRAMERREGEMVAMVLAAVR